MRNIWSVLIVFLFAVFLFGCQDNKVNDQEPPNIVFIIADDLSWDDLGCYGHPNIQTPNIDNLAANGMRFDQAFLTASSCSPSRSSIITGKYPHQTDAEQLHWPLPVNQITFVEKLKEAGYWTGQAGKWHLGEGVKNRFHKIMEVSVDGFQMKAGQKMATATNASGCEDWIPVLNSRAKNKPFFLWLAAVDPHRDYKKGSIKNPHLSEDIIVPPYLPDTKEVRTDLALYYDEIARLDSFVGVFISELEKQNLIENTLILFISDNGRPFPRDKTTLYDGGIKTPWIVQWPGKVKAGAVTKSLVSSIDIAPTFLKIAGCEIGGNFEGFDFSRLFYNQEINIRQSVYAEDHWHDFEDYSRAIRTKQFKYIRNFYEDLPNTPSADALRSITFEKMQLMRNEGKLSKDQMACFVVPRAKEELYDVETDPYELNNLVNNPGYSKILDDLRKEMEEIRIKTNDILPLERTHDEFDRNTGQPNKYRIRPRLSKAEMQKK
jgi:N-sulfoglucosamine sulfohydrolase